MKKFDWFVTFLFIIICLILVFVSWKVERNINYKFAYEKYIIENQINPLEKRIEVLEDKIRILEQRK